MYKIEDKGSSIVRIKTEWYENNVENNLNKERYYETLDEDPTAENKEAFDHEFDKMLNNVEIPANTHEFVTNSEPKLGVFYENPKTHKFKGIPAVKITVPEEGFPSRGIKSDLNTATEKPGDEENSYFCPRHRSYASEN